MAMNVAGYVVSPIASVQVPHGTAPSRLSSTGQRRVFDAATPTILGVTGLVQCTGVAIYHRASGVRGMFHFGQDWGGELEAGDPRNRKLGPTSAAITAFLQDLSQRGAVLNAVEISISGGPANDTCQLVFNRLQRVEPTLPFNAMVMYQGGPNFYLLPNGTLANGLIIQPPTPPWRPSVPGPGARRPNSTIGERH